MTSNFGSVMQKTTSITIKSVIFHSKCVKVRLNEGKPNLKVGDVISIMNMRHYDHLEDTPMTVTDIEDEHMSGSSLIRLELSLPTDKLETKNKDKERVIYTSGSYIKKGDWIGTHSYMPYETKNGKQMIEIYDNKFTLKEGQKVRLFGPHFTDKCKFKVIEVGGFSTKIAAISLEKLLDEHMKLNKKYTWPTLLMKILK